MIALESLTKIAGILNSNENKMNTLPIIIALAEDRSYRVKHKLA